MALLQCGVGWSGAPSFWWGFCVSGTWPTASASSRSRTWWWWATSRTPCVSSLMSSHCTTICVALSEAPGARRAKEQPGEETVGLLVFPRAGMASEARCILVWEYRLLCGVGLHGRPGQLCYWLQVPLSWALRWSQQRAGRKRKNHRRERNWC